MDLFEIDTNQDIFNLCIEVSERSDDPDTQIGCVIIDEEGEVLVVGWNGLPRGVKATPEKLTRPEKYKWIEHAERNAIYVAAREGIALKGAKLYCLYWPCPDCARAIVQSGIQEVITRGEMTLLNQEEEAVTVKNILECGSVLVRIIV